MSDKSGRRTYSAKEKLKIIEEGRASGANISEVCRRHGIAAQQFYDWERQAKEAALERFSRPKRRGLDKNQAKVDELAAENARLKDVIAEITSENLTLKKTLGN